MRRISSISELREARLQAKFRIAVLENQIKQDFESIRNDLKPWNLAGDALRKMLESDKNDVVSESIGLTVDALIKKVLFRKSNFLVKYVLAFALKNYARNLVAKNSENILDWIQHGLRKIKNSHHHNGELYDKSTSWSDVES